MKGAYTEKFVENLIKDYPYEFLGEHLKFDSQQPTLYGFRPDLIFKDSSGQTVILEIQLNALDRNHLYKSLEYRDLLIKEQGVDRARVILVSNSILDRHKRLLALHNIEFVMIPKESVIEKAQRLVPNLELMQTNTFEDKTDGDSITAERVLRMLGSKKNQPEAVSFNAVVLWTRSWGDRRDDFYNLTAVNLYDLQNQNDAYFSDIHRYAKNKIGDNGTHPSHLDVPEEIIVCRDAFADLTGEDIYKFMSWLELLTPYARISEYEDDKIVLGYRCNKDPYDYEDYVRNRIRKFEPIWRKYGLEVGYDVGLIASDLERLSKIILYAGKYPSLIPLRLCDGICLVPGPGILMENVERRKKLLNEWGRDEELAELEVFLVEDVREWVTVEFNRLCVPFLRTIRKLLHHIWAGHLNGKYSAEKIDLKTPCHLCLLRPKPIDHINPTALRLSARFFEHLHVPTN
jgi:hypothetical protein